MASYLAAIHKEGKSDYGVSFPDFPGCITAGKTMDEAREFAKEALELHIEGMIEEGLAIPEPRSMEQALQDKDMADAVFFVVDADAVDPVERVNITVRSGLRKRIDEAAKKVGLNRSQYLAEASEEKMERDARLGRLEQKQKEARKKADPNQKRAPRVIIVGARRRTAKKAAKKQKAS